MIDGVALMSLKGNFILGFQTVNRFTAKDVVKVKKAVREGVYDESYDMNKDGVLDQADIDLVIDKALNDSFS